MSIIEPPTAAVSTTSRNPFTLTAEAGGFVLACACRWLKFYVTRPDSDAGRREHEKRCKVARGEGE